MKVEVDHDRCEGHEKCQSIAPEVFEVRADAYSYVKLDDVPESFRAQVERAVRLCPRQAISVRGEP
jgi:ferredoxin